MLPLVGSCSHVSLEQLSADYLVAQRANNVVVRHLPCSYLLRSGNINLYFQSRSHALPYIVACVSENPTHSSICIQYISCPCKSGPVKCCVRAIPSSLSSASSAASAASGSAGAPRAARVPSPCLRYRRLQLQALPQTITAQINS